MKKRGKKYPDEGKLNPGDGKIIKKQIKVKGPAKSPAPYLLTH
jgi:hypothetical protein